MSRAAFTWAMRSMPSFKSVMDAYVQAFLEQVMVSVACNGAHSLKQRLARWLRLAPKMACTPLQPSLPIVAISTMLPSA